MCQARVLEVKLEVKIKVKVNVEELLLVWHSRLKGYSSDVVKWWIKKAVLPSSTLRHTCHGTQWDFVRMRGSGSRSIGRVWEDMIPPGCENPRNGMNLRNLWQSKSDKLLGKIECVFWFFDKLSWERDDVDQPWGLPNIYSPLLCLSLLPLSLWSLPIDQFISVIAGLWYTPCPRPSAKASGGGDVNQIFPPHLLPGSLFKAHLSSSSELYTQTWKNIKMT